MKGKSMQTKPNPQSDDANDSQSQLFADTNITMKSGRLTRDPEIVGDGKYVKVRIASNKQYEVDGEIKTNTNYFNVMVSSNLNEAFELTKSFKKGDWAYFKGEDSTKPFDTPEGYKQTASTIFAYHAVLKKEKTPEQSNTPKSETKNKSTKSTKPAVVEPA
ncbi:MAG: single-stranded DNA-binding protein [Cyclobacteriaceae bacterium]